MNEEKNEIINKLNSLITALESNMHSRLEAEKNMELINTEMKYIELGKLRDITNATDNEGKKLYSNETGRNTALVEDLRINLGYQELKKKASDQQVIIDECKVNYEIIKLKIKSIELEISLYKVDDELLKATMKYLRGDI